MLEINHLSIGIYDGKKGKEISIVQDISFSLKQKEIVAIIGESGSGKTMTALSIAGLLPEYSKISGEIYLNGVDLLSLNKKQLRSYQGKEIAMVYQDPMTSLNPVLRIGFQMEEPLILHAKLKKEERKRAVLEALKKAGLCEAEAIYQKYPHQLSGGMRQRVMIAMALICKPRLIIADEPTTALDVKVQEQILKLLKRINQEQETGILFISHNLNIVKDFCDRILVMHGGKIVEEGTPKEIFISPKMEYTKQLLKNILPKKAVQFSEQKQNMPKVLEVENLNVYYSQRNGAILRHNKKRKQVIFDASLEIYEGEIVGLVGRSGCGKSSLCKSILGLNTEREGVIQHYTTAPQMIFQDTYGALNPARRIEWILCEPLKIQRKLSRQQQKEKVFEMLEKVELGREYADRRPNELSGGQRQRVGIALALMLGSKFIIADEPVSALDVTIQKQILKLLLELREEYNLSYLFISHDMDVISQMCDRVIEMREGKLYKINNN